MAHVTYMSPRTLQVLGWPNTNWLDDPHWGWSRVHPDDTGPIAEAFRTGNLHHGVEYDFRFMHADGRYRHCRNFSTYGYDNDGEPNEIIGYWTVYP